MKVSEIPKEYKVFYHYSTTMDTTFELIVARMLRVRADLLLRLQIQR